jgi:hypothetical protein
MNRNQASVTYQIFACLSPAAFDQTNGIPAGRMNHSAAASLCTCPLAMNYLNWDKH